MALSTGASVESWRTGESTYRPPAGGLSLSGSASNFLRRWDMATRDREKRQRRRRSLHCPVQLVDDPGVGETKVTEAECINIGDGGLFAIVSGTASVSLGQRFTFRLNIGERGPEPGCRQYVSQQGEVIRLELLMGEKGYADRIGIGVRLFGPRCGIVPMPSSR
jgi:hypothetical protein